MVISTMTADSEQYSSALEEADITMGPGFQTSIQQYAFQSLTTSPTNRLTRSSSVPSTLKPMSPLKRSLIQEPPLLTTPKPKKPKHSALSHAPPSKYASLVNNLTDSLAPNLICMFIGTNPGLRTAKAGHAYAHPSNLFWRLLHSSGCTPRRCAPEEDGDLPHLFNLGNTNIVTRPTKDASELSKAEMDEGVWVLEEKIKKWRPESVAIVGKSIWESIWRVKHGRGIKKGQFHYGWQEEKWGAVENWKGTKVFVATSTSGLAARMSLDEKEEVWRGLGTWVQKRREERKALLNIEGVKSKEDVELDEELKSNGDILENSLLGKDIINIEGEISK